MGFPQKIKQLGLSCRKKKKNRSERTSFEFQEKNKNYYRYIENYDWTETTDHFRGLETIFHRVRIKSIKNLIEEHGKGERYLDAGCGTGAILRYLPKGSVGLDINPRNIQKAKKYAPEAVFIEGDIEAMPLPDHSFTTAICTEVLEHLPSPTKALQEIRRILEPEGIFIGSVPRRSLIWALRFLSSTCPRAEPFHKEYTKKELQKLLGNHFEIVKLSYTFGWMNFLFVCTNKPG